MLINGRLNIGFILMRGLQFQKEYMPHVIVFIETNMNIGLTIIILSKGCFNMDSKLVKIYRNIKRLISLYKWDIFIILKRYTSEFYKT